jgi:hypothetical protein
MSAKFLTSSFLSSLMPDKITTLVKQELVKQELYLGLFHNYLGLFHNQVM